MVGPLLSSVSLLLAAFGFVYNAQKERIDAALADTDIPADADVLKASRAAAASARNSAVWLLVAALVMWLLLIDEIEHKAAAAIRQRLALNTYSTPDAVFFVAANTWLVIAIFLALRACKLKKRVAALDAAA